MSKTKFEQEDWAKEFQAFTSAAAIEPPKHITSGIIAKVRGDLNPSNRHVFSKMALIHFFVGTLMLLVCPQFGLALFDGLGLMAVFMRFGETACAVVCGGVFLGASALVASLTLSPEEIRKIRRTEPLQLGGLALLSVGVFICLGASVVATLGLAWVLGSVAGGLATFELGWCVRSRLRRRLIYGA